MTSQDDHLNKHLIQGYEQLLQSAQVGHIPIPLDSL